MAIRYVREFNMPEQIKAINYLNSINITGYYKEVDGGFCCAIDQKNTYDLLNVICKCVLNLSNQKIDFKIKDFFDDEYSKNILRDKTYDNGKAILRNETLKEYDKIFGNTLETLAYTEILTKKYNGKTRVFSIKNKEILVLLSNSEHACLAFLSHFIFLLTKNDTNIFEKIEKITKNPFNENYKKDFKNTTVNWLKNNSNRNADSTQICKKIDNYLFYLFDLYKYNSNKKTKYLKQSLKDLSYFRVHVRDKNKKHRLTRKENYNFVSKGKNNFKYDNIKQEIVEFNKKMNNSSIVHSELKIYEPYELNSYHVHHIFPRSYWDKNDINEFIEPDMPENLMIMNQTEHYDYAHNFGDTKAINENNLLDILQKQYEKINRAISYDDNIYNLKRFYYLLCKIFNLKTNESLENDFLIKNIEEILYD